MPGPHPALPHPWVLSAALGKSNGNHTCAVDKATSLIKISSPFAFHPNSAGYEGYHAETRSPGGHL